jgi:hypothetical protein
LSSAPPPPPPHLHLHLHHHHNDAGVHADDRTMFVAQAPGSSAIIGNYISTSHVIRHIVSSNVSLPRLTITRFHPHPPFLFIENYLLQSFCTRFCFIPLSQAAAQSNVAFQTTTTRRSRLAHSQCTDYPVQLCNRKPLSISKLTRTQTSF